MNSASSVSVQAADRASSLSPRLGTASAVALVVSNMVGTGIFSSTGLMAAALGDPWLILLAWFLGGVISLAGALSYAELGLNFRESGGEYVYLRSALGPAWGFAAGWVSFFAGFSAPIATAALVFASYADALFPQLHEWVLIDTAALHLTAMQLLAPGAVALFTALNCAGVRSSAWIQNLLTAAKIGAVVALILAGFWSGQGSWDHFQHPVARTSVRPLGVEFAIQLLWVMVAYSGWNAASYVTEELKTPKRTLFIAPMVGTALVTALYVGLNVLFVYSTPVAGLRGEVAVGQVAVLHLFGAGASQWFGLLMILVMLATVNAMMTIGPRVYYAMALQGAFPSVAAKVDTRRRTPTNAILIQGVCAALMTLSSIPGLFTFMGFSLTLFSVLAVVSLLRFRRMQDWTPLPALNFCFPLIPLGYVAAGVCMVAWGALFQPVASAAALGTTVLGAGSYWFYDKGAFSKVAGRGPARTAEDRVGGGGSGD